MKRHFSILVCALVAVAMMFSLASCEALGLGTQHEHTYSGVWSNDATNHWHAATCQEDGCAEAKAAVTAHSDANNDKICDVCAYDMGHEHAYSASWVSNAESHWHVASCGHNVVADKAAHTLDAAGRCTVCDYESGSIDVAKAVQLGASFKNLVKSGVSYYTYASYAGGDFNSYSVNYEYGNNVLHVIDGGTEYEYWYSLDGEKIFAVQEYKSYDGSPAVALVEDLEVNVLEGYNFSNVFNAYGEEEFYGAEALVSGLYALAAENFGDATTEYTAVVDGVTYYMFSFATVEYDTEYDYEVEDFVETDVVKNLYEVTVMFTITDSYSIDSVMVDTTKYAVLDYDEDYNLVDSGVVAFEYDKVDNTKIVGYSIAKYSASASFSYAVEQTEGERTLVSKYTPETALISSFALEFEDGTPVTETINMVAGTPIHLYLGSIAPATANIALDSVKVTCENDAPVYGYYDSYSESVSVKAYEAGTYEITVSTAKASAKFTIAVTLPATTEISASVNDNDVEEYNCYSDSTGGATVTFGAVANEYADAGYTAILPPNVTDATLTNNEDGTYTFVSTTVGTWEILITSTANSEVTSTLTITVQTPPAISDVLNGEWAIAGNMMTPEVNAVFVPASEGATNGEVTVDYYYNNWMWGISIEAVEVYTYTYDAETGIKLTSKSITSSDESLESLGLYFSIDENYKIKVMDNNAGMYVLSRVAPAGSNVLVVGENTITVQDTTQGDTYSLPVNADEAVTYILTVGENAVIINGNDVYTQSGATVEITVPAGETVSVGIGAYYSSDNVARITVAVKAAE